MLCDEVTALLPALVDGDDADPQAALHIETCLRCQAELARYRRLLRTLALLRTRYAEPTPGLLGETLASRALAGASLIVCAVVVMTVGIGPLRRRLARYTARSE